MRNLRLLFLSVLASGFISEKVFVSSQTTFSTTDDLYLEGQTSGELSIDDDDDDDDGEDDDGSGSGDYAHTNFSDKEEKLSNVSRTTVSKELLPSQPQPSAASPLSPSTTVVGPTADWFTQSTSTSPSSTTSPPWDTSPTSIDVAVVDYTDGENALDRGDVSPPKNRGDETRIGLVDNEILAEKGQNGRMYEIDTPEEVSSENMWERTEVLAAVIACGVVGFLCAVFLLLLLAYRMKKKDEGSYELGDTKVSTTAYQKAPTKEFYA
ncbi:uncharacterized protein AB9W97_017622 [Spinachia spinachia]